MDGLEEGKWGPSGPNWEAKLREQEELFCNSRVLLEAELGKAPGQAPPPELSIPPDIPHAGHLLHGAMKMRMCKAG